MKSYTLLMVILLILCGGQDGRSNEDEPHLVMLGSKGNFKLGLFENDQELASVTLPTNIQYDNGLMSIKNAVWNNNRHAVAVAFELDARSRIYAFVKKANGVFIVCDLSRVEFGNIGKTGISPSKVTSAKSKPVGWLLRKDSLYQIHIETKITSAASKAQTTSEKLVINNEGVAIFR